MAAVLLSAAAQLVRLPLDPPTLLPFITYIPFMTVSAWFGGVGPGLLATALCTLESMYFDTPLLHSLGVSLPQNWLGLGLLGLSGVVKSILFERLKQGKRKEAADEEIRMGLAEQLELRRQTLELIVQHSPAAIAIVTGPDFRITTLNPAYQALAPGEPMIGRTTAEVWPEAATVILPILHTVREAKTVYHATGFAIPRRHGPGTEVEERYFDISYVPVDSGDQEDRVTVLVVAVEVTERKKAEDALRAAYIELAAIYANAPAVLLVVDEELRVEKLNDVAARLAGREVSELLGLRPGAVIACLDALKDPQGCGNGPSCSQCALRLAVRDSVQTGARHERIEAWIPSRRGSFDQRHRCFLVFTAPLSLDHRRKALVCAQDITDLKRTEKDLRESVDKLEAALTEKTVLLQEVHHRVKNNLAVISSLLSMQEDSTEAAEVRLALAQSQRRVHSIALIHEHLYGTEHLDRINFAEYVQRLVQVIYADLTDQTRITFRLEIEPIELGVHVAVPAALILNELVSNTIKHAFPGDRHGEVRITFRETEPGNLELAVEDDGVGAQDSPAVRTTKSIGLQIVRILTTQLAGTLRQEGSSGTRVVLRFPSAAAYRAAR